MEPDQYSTFSVRADSHLHAQCTAAWHLRYIAEHGTFIQSFTYLSRLRMRERLRDKDRDTVKERQRN